jgi:mRNA interferase MazF
MAGPFMIKYKIVLVPFPFDDLSNTKVRPAICLTDSIGEFEHVVIAFISSKMPDRPLQSDVLISKVDTCFRQTGLLVDSVIRLHKLVTLPKQLIKRELGSANDELSHSIKEKIKGLFL